MDKCKVIYGRRNFKAKKFQKGSVERKQLNKDSRTSEYLPSYKYYIKGFMKIDGEEKEMFSSSEVTLKEIENQVDEFRTGKREFWKGCKIVREWLKMDKIYSANEILRKEYGDSRNFMTPNKVKVGKIAPNIAFELSSGKGIGDTPLFGVSVASIDEKGNTKREFDLSKSFGSNKNAEKHIIKLKENINECKDKKDMSSCLKKKVE